MKYITLSLLLLMKAALASSPFSIFGMKVADICSQCAPEDISGAKYTISVEKPHFQLNVNKNGVFAEVLNHIESNAAIFSKRLSAGAQVMMTGTEQEKMDYFKEFISKIVFEKDVTLTCAQDFSIPSSTLLYLKESATISAHVQKFGQQGNVVYCVTNGLLKLTFLDPESVLESLTIHPQEVSTAFASCNSEIIDSDNEIGNLVSVFGLTGSISGVPENEGMLIFLGVKNVEITTRLSIMTKYLPVALPAQEAPVTEVPVSEAN